MTVRIIKKGNSVVQKPVQVTVANVAVLMKNAKSALKRSKRVEVIKKQPNMRQQKVISLISGNVGKSKAEILRKAGYPPSTVDNPDHVFKSPIIQEAINPVVAQMQRIRTSALNALEKKPMAKQSPYNLVIVSDSMTKNSELLSGRPTDRTNYQLPEADQKKLDSIFEKNKKK